MRNWIVACTMLAMAPMAYAQQLPTYDTRGIFAGTYRCVTEIAGGVAWNATAGRWEGTSLDYGDQWTTLTISPTRVIDLRFDGGSVPAMAYRVNVKNNMSAESELEAGFDCWTPHYRDNASPHDINDIFIYAKSGAFRCTAILDEYAVNLEKLRFLKTNTIGYVDGADNGSNVPNIQAGHCTKQ